MIYRRLEMPRSTFGSRLRRARKQRGFSQTEMARAMKVAIATANRWERAGVMPSYRRMRALATLLGVDFDWLADGKRSAA